MDLLSTQQVSASSLGSIDFELFITVAGTENRCIYFAENYNISVTEKVALTDLIKNKELFRKNNNRILKSKGFKFLEFSTTDNHGLANFLKAYLLNAAREKIKILVDYSCMPRTWYSSIINIFQELEYLKSHVYVYFVYTPVKFQKALKISQQKTISQSLTRNVNTDLKPTALIVGLGTEKANAELINDIIKPDLLILMYSDPALEKVYVENIFKRNEKIISLANTRNLINYPIKDAEKINLLITQKCVELRLTHNVIIAPFGPKIFSLNAYLVASRYPDIEIINPEERKIDVKNNREPSGDVIVQKVEFVTEEDYL